MERVIPLGPFACLTRRRRSDTHQINGKYVNLSEVHRVTRLDHGYLSRIFTKQRVPSVQSAQLIADALHMELDDFLYCLGLKRADAIQKSQPDQSPAQD